MKATHSGAIAGSAGERLASSRAAVIMVHGRGDSARGILGLAAALPVPEVAFVAPQATGNTWYPNSFLAPRESNEPWISSALDALDAVFHEVLAAGVPAERVVIAGFSQGACLASEYAARNARRYGGVAALSGGLIGPRAEAADYSGDLAGTPAFLGCSDVDPHIPVERVHRSADILAGMGARVEKRIYPGFGHAVNQDEVDWLVELLRELVAPGG